MEDPQKLTLDLVHLLILPLVLLMATSGSHAVQSRQASLDQGLFTDHRVEHIQYRLDPDNPNNFASASFKLGGSDDQVYLGLGDRLGFVEWVPCRSGNGGEYRCDLQAASIQVAQAVEVHISSSLR